MTRVFGEVAAIYDEARQGYPDDLLAAVTGYHGGVPASVADVGAGTGKGTGLLLRLGVPVTAVEPDPRMAAVLTRKFPQVEVANAAFEDWTPPPGGVGLLACATAWHWMDERTRERRARTALVPRGTLAVFHNSHGYAVPRQKDAIDAIHQAIDPTPTVDDREVAWARGGIERSGLFADVEVHEWHRHPVLTTEQYLRLLQTFSTFRNHSARDRKTVVANLSAAIDGFGGAVEMDIHTVLVLARAA
ncbi:class I SAM-dependent methyltransferase [Actinoplanes sp. NPDC049118]|uniref:class I SAM-dependent methyltransferase n=1 Tax=Actinoplanes sp. NPDC049118 TaxID=3155769 RepID=UPI0033EA80C2